MNNSEEHQRFLSALKKDLHKLSYEEFTKSTKKRGWFYAWVGFYVYIAAILGIMYLIAGGDVHAPMSRVTFFLFVPVFIFLAASAHLTGVAPSHFMNADRVKQPGSFWMLVTFYWFGALAFLVIGFGAVFGFWK